MTKIRKMYKFENKTMKERGVVGIEIDIEKRILYLEQVKGNAPSLECFLELLQIEEIEEALKEATQGYIRMNPWKINCYISTSGAMDFYIAWIEGYGGNFPCERQKHLLHVSMCDKLNEGVEIFIPDLLLLVPELEYYTSNNEEIYISEVQEVSLEDYRNPLEQFKPVMAYLNEADYFERGEQRGVQACKDLYSRIAMYQTIAEWVVSKDEYEAMKYILTHNRKAGDFDSGYHLYENQKKNVFVLLDNASKTTDVVIKKEE